MLGDTLHVDINSGQSAAKGKKREKLLIEISPAQVGGTENAKQGKVSLVVALIAPPNHLPLRQCDVGSSIGFDEN